MSPIYTNGWDYSFSDFFPMLDSGEGYGREKNVETVKEKERYVQRRVVCLGKGKKFSVADAQTLRAGNSKGGD